MKVVEIKIVKSIVNDFYKYLTTAHSPYFVWTSTCSQIGNMEVEFEVEVEVERACNNLNGELHPRMAIDKV